MDTISIKSSGQLGQNILKRIKTNKLDLEVGFFNPEVASYATTNEYGAVINNVIIPARPFMQMTVDKNKKKWIELLPKLTQKYDGDVTKSFNALGSIVKDDIADMITHGSFKPNAPMTIRLKGKDTPLRDTMRMLDSIEWNVTK